MQLINNTPLHAAAIATSQINDWMTILLLISVTYKIRPGELSVAREQRPLYLSGASRYPSDVQFYSEGISICVDGFVYSKNESSTSATASVCVGETRRTIIAYGPRVWRRNAHGDLVPTAPKPFKTVTMSWSSAYGGCVTEPTSIMSIDGEEALIPEHQCPFLLNGDGMGFYLRADDAVGKPLPQLEHPNKLIEKWSDRPDPVCFAPYPIWGGMRIRSLIDHSDGKIDLRRIGRLATLASPWMVFSGVTPGTNVLVEGMRPMGETLSFEVPLCPVELTVNVGARSMRVSPRLGTIHIDAESETSRHVYRALYSYPLVQFEARTACVDLRSHISEPV